jgi:hypothetical protein
MDLLVSRHEAQMASTTQGIDYRKIVSARPWPFHAFARTLSRLMGREEGLSTFTAGELEALKKFYNQYPGLTESLLTEAFSRTSNKELPYLLHDLKANLPRKE